jgi:hypothetical protein
MLPANIAMNNSTTAAGSGTGLTPSPAELAAPDLPKFSRQST